MDCRVYIGISKAIPQLVAPGQIITACVCLRPLFVFVYERILDVGSTPRWDLHPSRRDQVKRRRDNINQGVIPFPLQVYLSLWYICTRHKSLLLNETLIPVVSSICGRQIQGNPEILPGSSHSKCSWQPAQQLCACAAG